MDFQNPYSPPAAPSFAPPAMPAQQMKIAGQGKRFINFILDQIFTGILGGIVGLVFGFTFAIMRADPSAPMLPQEEFQFQLISQLLGIGLSIVYFTLLESLTQRSLAKFITGTKVVQVDGSAPTVGQIIGRTFARFIPFEPFSLLGGKNPVGWHDSLSKTRVIEVS
jgi:uncharacterized RDD family membrane protein YckC